jgi:hypothetical protein
MSNRKHAQDIRTPAQLVTAHLTPINVGYSAIIYSPTNPWEILGSAKILRVHAYATDPRNARDDCCRSDLLLLAEWAHALPNYQGAHCRPDDLRRKSPPAPLH